MIEERKTMKQLSFALSRQSGSLVAAENADEDVRRADFKAMQASLLALCPVWPHGFRSLLSAHPIVTSQSQLSKFRHVHELLSAAITNIVERWWTDEAARFPDRMPLEKHEEEVLRWMNSLDQSVLPPFKTRQGSWRPDFLLENSHLSDAFRICEINSRFALNLFFHSAFAQQAHIEMEDKSLRLIAPTAKPQEIMNGIFSLFDPSLPVHLLKGEETGLDIHQFVEHVHQATGWRPSLISPANLRLMPCSSSVTGQTLYCEAGKSEDGVERLEPVHQIGLELQQHELHSLPQAMLKEIALRCFNDLRTIFLVHDKRMLGIVLQELDNLVHKHGLFGPAQAETLRRSITPTIIPGSQGMAAMIHFSRYSPQIREDFLLKPIRGGKGVGISFGSDMTAEQWISELELLRQAELAAGRAQYVVQRRIEQPQFDVLLEEAEKGQRFYLVGTYMAIHGMYLGLGLWRTSAGRICALSHGGHWVCSVAPWEETNVRITSPGI